MEKQRQACLNDFLSRPALCREHSAIREITDVLFNGKEIAPEGFIELGHGDPNENLFPWESASFKLKDGTVLEINNKLMNVALQYGPSGGSPALVEILRKFQLHFHSKSGSLLSNLDGWGVLPCTGAMDGVSKVCEMFLNEGDTYLLEIPAYPNIYAAMRPLGGRPICCDADSSGLNPDRMRKKIQEALAKGWPTPKFLYTCPTATNPSGIATQAERRIKIYELACEYNFYIIEDDPYYFVNFDEELFKTIPSYLSLDTQRRVIRIDSFSKVLSAGLRLGYITAPSEVIDVLDRHMQASQIHPSQLIQVLVSQLLTSWGIERFLENARKVSKFYKNQMEIMCAAADKHLAGVAEYERPYGGLFLWIKILPIADTKSLIMGRAGAKKILLMHGSAFEPNFAEPEQIPAGAFKQYIRAAYSLLSEKEIYEAFQRLREAIDEELAGKGKPKASQCNIRVD